MMIMMTTIPHPEESSIGLDDEMRRCCFIDTSRRSQQVQGGGDVQASKASSQSDDRKANGQQGKNKNSNKKSKQQQHSRSQHSLEHLQRRVSELMSIFQEHDWFVPLPSNSENGGGKGKVKSNRNYGADKKLQRKHAQRQLLERRIQQLETCLKQEHGFSVS